MAKTSKKDAKELLQEARDRYKIAVEADKDNRKLGMDDLKFANEPGEQWDVALRTERGNRPCYEFNKIRVTCKRIINDIRSNRPQGKVRAVEDGDVDTAQTVEGLVRNIWNVSDGDSAVDHAAEYQVTAGMGAWRIVTEYSDDTAWDQDIKIKPITNPFCLYVDPACMDPVKRDARYWFITSTIAKEVYEDKYGKIPAVEFEKGEFDDDDDWGDDDGVRICEYWYKKPIAKTLYLLPDGATVDELPQGVEPLRTRQVQTNQICMIVMSGDKILEGPVEWAGAHFPFVMVYGEAIVIDGKRKWWGLTRHAKDAQRSYNFSRTLAAESVALAPQFKWWATPMQAEGLVEQWATAHQQNLPFMLFNADPSQPGAPQRMGGADIPAALVQEMQISSEDIKAVTGIYDASLGQRSNETTGVAIRARQNEGAIATFNYSDNMARGIRRTWEILIDLIPKVYDTERSIRILGTDGAEKYVKVNHVDPITGQTENDLSRGKFDVAITVGPNFSTQRQEAAEVYMQLAQANPAVFGVAGDLIFKSMDLPYADDIAERMKVILPPPVQQMLQAKEKGGKALPPEVMQAMQQADQAMQMVQQQAQMVQQAAQEAQGMKAEADKAASDLQVQAAKLNADYQRILADIAKKEANLTLNEAQLVQQQTQAGVDQQGTDMANERENLGSQVTAALAQIQQQVADYMTQAAGAMAQMQAHQAAQASQPKVKRTRMTKLPNGQYEAITEES